MSPMFLDGLPLGGQLYVLPVLGGHQLLVLADQLVDQPVLPHDLSPQDGVKTRNVAGVSGHHLQKIIVIIRMDISIVNYYDVMCIVGMLMVGWECELPHH